MHAKLQHNITYWGKRKEINNLDSTGVTIYGITDPARFDQRAPTVAFTLDGYTPRQAAERLGQEGIFVWD